MALKIDIIKNSGGFLRPLNEESQELILSLPNDKPLQHTVKLNHNYALLQKMHVFFKFCAQHYYGDMNVNKSQIELTKKNILINAGYFEQVFYPDGVQFEIKARSISYAKMTQEERIDCANRLTTAAMKVVFHSADNNTYNQLLAFFG